MWLVQEKPRKYENHTCLQNDLRVVDARMPWQNDFHRGLQRQSASFNNFWASTGSGSRKTCQRLRDYTQEGQGLARHWQLLRRQDIGIWEVPDATRMFLISFLPKFAEIKAGKLRLKSRNNLHIGKILTSMLIVAGISNQSGYLQHVPDSSFELW